MAGSFRTSKLKALEKKRRNKTLLLRFQTYTYDLAKTNLHFLYTNFQQIGRLDIETILQKITKSNQSMNIFVKDLNNIALRRKLCFFPVFKFIYCHSCLLWFQTDRQPLLQIPRLAIFRLRNQIKSGQRF